jgi:branched-chain amino acid transport system substrate-binding protein
VTSINGVDAIIGSNFDFVVIPLFEEARKNSTVVISPTSPRIAGALDTNDNSFTMLSDFSEIVYALNGYLSKTPYEKMTVIHYNSAFGSEIVKTINAINAEHSKPAVIDETYNEFGLGDWTPYILKMKRDGVNMVFADMLGTDYLKFATQAKQLGLEAQLVTSMDVREGLKDTSVDLSVLEGTVVLNWDVLGNDAVFNAKFTEKYGREADHFAAQAYVAVYVLRDAVSKAETKIDIPTFATPLGSFSFTENHTQAKTNVAIQVIKDGKLVPLQ